MKDKIVKWKDQIVAKMAENKKLSAICITAAIVAVLVIVVAVAGLGGGSQSGKSNDAQLKNDQTVETDKKKTDSTEKQTEKDKKTEEKSTTGKDKKDAVKSDGTTGETTAQAGGEQQTTKAGVAGGTVDQSSTKSQNGGSNNNAGNSNANTGNTNSSNLNAGNTNAGSSNANTGNTNTGNTGNSAGGNRNSGNTNSGNVNTGNANAGTANQGGNQTAGGSSGNTSQNQGGSTNQNTGSGNQGSNTAVHSGTDSVQPNEENIYNQLFDINNKVTISLDISEAELRKLQADYKQYGNGKSPIYRRVTKMTVTINNTSYDMYDVGVRMKGNTSRCDVFNNGDVNNRNMIHLKLSFDEAFDEKDYYGAEALQWSEGDRKERKGRTFATLDGLELKWNRNFDSTYVTNVYANQMYRALGVYAQNTSLANVRFAGYNYGVYTIYEPVGKKFLKRYMGNAKDGDLYKCGWSNVGASYTKNTLSSIGIETPYRSLTYDLKTNKSTSNHESLKNLINQMNNSPSKETFASLVDVDQWVMFAAVSYFIGNPDDLRNNYNNHYVYFKNGKAVFIPYDYDRCFGIGTEKKEDMTAYSPYADNTALQGGQSNPIYLRSITGRSNQYTTEYTNALKKVAESGWINYSNYLNYYNAARNNYASVAIPDGNVHIYVKPFGSSSGRNYDTSALGFAESNSTNSSVSTYFTKIMESYRTAMAKWN